MDEVYKSLAWLRRPPADFAAACRSVVASTEDLGARLQWLAGHALDEPQLYRLARQVAMAREAGHSLAPLTPFKLGLISNATTEFICPALIATALRHGIDLECFAALFGQVAQAALAVDSSIKQAQPDAILIAVDYRGLPLRPIPGDADGAKTMVQNALDHLMTIREGIKRDTNAICVFQTVARPAETCFGSLDFAMPGTLRHMIDALNRGIAASLADTDDLLLDIAGLAETVGLCEWHSPIEWNLAKLPFANEFVPLYADYVCRAIAALRGKSRRCLVLDLDNTLWGGVIGDDGVEGILACEGDPTGEAHLHLQGAALSLRERGIVLAVCSKNDDEIARSAFREHSEMLLREEHIAIFQANWQDKASNIKAIADELSLGLDGLVFLDDNPTERGLIRSLLPQVAVPEIPADPSLFARTLLASGYFEATTFSAEDRARADFYRDNARRIALQQQVGDVESYLESLQMLISFRPFDEVGRARIAQLINKSNQFNLTTRRYTEAEVREVASDPDCFTLQVSLSDIYGDNGMISVIICRLIEDSDWHIDTWLMSCRVLGRRVEDAILQELLYHARDRGIRRLIGKYRPTERNKLVEDHYAKLGFAPIDQTMKGITWWAMEVACAPVQVIPIAVERSGFDLVGA